MSEPEDDDMQIAELLRIAGHRPEPAPFRAARVRTAVEAEWRAAVRRRDRRTMLQWVGLAVAASVLIVVSGKWLLPAQPSESNSASNAAANPGTNGMVVVAHLARATGLVTIAENRTDAWRLLGPNGTVNGGAAIRTDAQSRAALTLAEGQSLRLDMDTLVIFESETRVRLERGSVYLDSGKRGAGAGVEVVTPFGTLRDVGTQFEVSLVNSGLRLRVREGEVALTHRDVRVAAARGESVSVARDGTVTRGSVPTSGPEWEWTSAAAPAFQLEDASLSGFLDWVSREEGWDWHYADAATKQRGAGVVLHGSIDKLTPAEALDAVLPTCGMAWRLEGGSLIINLAAADK